MRTYVNHSKENYFKKGQRDVHVFSMSYWNILEGCTHFDFANFIKNSDSVK